MSFFSRVSTVSIDIFALFKRFYEDACDDKINLAIGAYRDNDGKPWTLPVVRDLEKALANDETLDKEYLPPLGLEDFTDAATRWLVGEKSPALLENRAFGIQTASGANALRIGAEFLARVMGKNTFYFSNPTWRSHQLLFQNGGFTDARQYRYWCETTQTIDLEGFLEDLRHAPEYSVIILHACAHNPTGCDPTKEQWRKIGEVMKEKRLFPFFDTALQGFATGDLEEDASIVRFFVEQGFELFCAQSFSKNLGLYGERVGNLLVVLNDPILVEPVKYHFKLIVGGMYLNPPSHGARIVSCVLKDPHLYQQWQDNVRTMFSRITEMRKTFRKALEDLNAPGDWSLITRQVGMTCSIPLSVRQCDYLMREHHIYILSSGRFNICAVTPSNVSFIAEAIYETIRAST